MSIGSTASAALDPWAGLAPGRWQDDVDPHDFLVHNLRSVASGLPDAPAMTPRGRALAEQAAHGLGAWTPELVVGLPVEVWARLAAPGPERGEFDDGASATVRTALASGLLSGLPLGPGRVLADYRRVALYGVDRLREQRREVRDQLDAQVTTVDSVRRRRELSAQVVALDGLVDLGRSVGADLTRPARTAREAAQWMLLAYLGVLLADPCAEVALGRLTPLLDVYVGRDLAQGLLDESSAQELLDEVLLTAGLVQALRGRAVTVTLGGMGDDGRPCVTDSCLRLLRSYGRVGRAAVPQPTVLWAPQLPGALRSGVAALALAGVPVVAVSAEAVQRSWDEDVALVGDGARAVAVGRQERRVGPRVNVAKVLLLALNGGRDELTGRQVGPLRATVADDPLTAAAVRPVWSDAVAWAFGVAIDATLADGLARDQAGREHLARALVDASVVTTVDVGVVGLCTAADALAAVQQAAVHPLLSRDGLVIGARVDGSLSRLVDGDPAAVAQADAVLHASIAALAADERTGAAAVTLSVVPEEYLDGAATGATPDGRPAQAPLGGPVRDPQGYLRGVGRLAQHEARGGLLAPLPVDPAALAPTPPALAAALDDALVEHGVFGVMLGTGPWSQEDGMTSL